MVHTTIYPSYDHPPTTLPLRTTRIHHHYEHCCCSQGGGVFSGPWDGKNMHCDTRPGQYNSLQLMGMTTGNEDDGPTDGIMRTRMGRTLPQDSALPIPTPLHLVRVFYSYLINFVLSSGPVFFLVSGQAILMYLNVELINITRMSRIIAPSHMHIQYDILKCLLYNALNENNIKAIHFRTTSPYC